MAEVKIPCESPKYGMNSYDDRKRLAPGQCVNLENAFPDDPLRPRAGHFIQALTMPSGNAPDRIYPRGALLGDNNYVWTNQSSVGTYPVKLTKIPYNTSGDDLANIGGGAGADFAGGLPDFIGTEKVHSSIYSVFSKALSSWNSGGLALGHKVVESDGTTIRDMCIAASANMKDPAVILNASGVFYDGDTFEYRMTYVRRTDTLGTGAAADPWETGTLPTGMIAPPGITGKKPKRVDVFNPGAVESIEVLANRKQVLVDADPPTGTAPTAIIYSSDQKIWVTNFGDDTVSKINGYTMLIMGEYATGDGPIHLCYNDYYDIIAVLNSDLTMTYLREIDGIVVGTYLINYAVGPIKIFYDSDHGTWVLYTDSNTYALVKFNGSTGAQILTAGSFAGTATDVVFDSVSDSIWVTLTNGKLVKHQASDGALVVAYAIELNMMNIAFVASDPAIGGPALWIRSYYKQMIKVNATTGALVAYYSIETLYGKNATPHGGVVYDSTNNAIWVVSALGTVLVKINQATGAILGEYPIDPDCGGLAWDSSGDTIFIFNFTSEKTLRYYTVTGSKYINPNPMLVRLNIDLDSDYETGDDHAAAIAQGATHLRVFRTRTFQGEGAAVNAAGATAFFLMDLPLGVSSYTFDDTTSDDTLSGETNQCITQNYTNAPTIAKFITYIKNRMVLFGISTKKGLAYFSEGPGGDGGTDLVAAQTYPMKWASLYKPTEYFVDLDSEDQQDDNGMCRSSNDLYFFRETKTYVMLGGDVANPNSSPTLVSSKIGCAFPHTVTPCEVKGFFGNCVLFLSNEGPMVITEGGRMRPFSEFKIKELWPEKSQELYGDLKTFATTKAYIQTNCTAQYCDNTWWVFYRNYAGVQRCFGYYFDPAVESEPSAPRGPFEMKSASIGVAFGEYKNLRAHFLIPGTKANVAIGLIGITGSTTDAEFVSCRFLGNGTDFRDKCIISSTSYYGKYDLKMESRPIYTSQDEVIVGELLSVDCRCEFRDDAELDNGFDVELRSDTDRFTESVDVDTNQQFVSNVKSAAVTGTVSTIFFTRSSGEWVTGSLVGGWGYFYVSTAPGSGSWIKIFGNNTTFIIAVSNLPSGCNRVAISARPYFRHNTQLIPKEGFFGTFFSLLLTKRISQSGFFKWFGHDSKIIPRPEIEAESLTGGGAITTGWTE